MVNFHSSLSSTSQRQLRELWGAEGKEWSNPKGQNWNYIEKQWLKKTMQIFIISFKFTRTVPNSTKLVNRKAVFIPSTPTTPVPSMCIVTKRQTVGGGQCSRRDWTARLISIAAGKTTHEALEIWMVSFGSDWTRFIAWQKNETGFMWILKRQLEKQLTLNTTFLVLQVREVNTSWVWEHIRVNCAFIKIISYSSIIGINFSFFFSLLATVNSISTFYCNIHSLYFQLSKHKQTSKQKRKQNPL